MYRFSLSWPRLYPKGNAREFNQDAVNYYNRLINTLKENGIEPYVSIWVYKLINYSIHRISLSISLFIIFVYYYIRKRLGADFSLPYCM